MYFCSNLIKKIKSFVYILTLSVINWYVKMTYIFVSFILFYVIISEEFLSYCISVLATLAHYKHWYVSEEEINFLAFSIPAFDLFLHFENARKRIHVCVQSFCSFK